MRSLRASAVVVLMLACCSRASDPDTGMSAALACPHSRELREAFTPVHAVQRGLPIGLSVLAPVIGNGLVVPSYGDANVEQALMRCGKWTYSYVRTTNTTADDGTPVWHFGPLSETEIGIESTGQFRNNYRDGGWCFWYPSGQLRARGSFAGGKLHGEWEFWSDDGRRDDALSGVYDHDVRLRDDAH
jgi:hypothetical protein